MVLCIIRCDRHYSREFHDYSPTIRTPKGGGHLPMVVQRGRGKNKGGLKNICPTITKNQWEYNNLLNHQTKIRRLTPKECERHQGFPDKWTEGVSVTNLGL